MKSSPGRVLAEHPVVYYASVAAAAIAMAAFAARAARASGAVSRGCWAMLAAGQAGKLAGMWWTRRRALNATIDTR